MHYRELFKLCDYSEKEITQESARIEKTFEKAGITPADVDRAVERLNKYFWMESAGVRTIWGIWMKQFIDLALCREEHKKIVYYTYPLEPRLGCAINLAGYFSATPEFVNMFILGVMFGIADSYFDLAEANGMTPGTGMCGANKMRLGGFLKGLNPMPDVFLVSSFFCDNEAKTDELIGYHFPGIPRIVIDNTLDSNWEVYPANYPAIEDHKVKYFASELRGCLNDLRDHHGVIVSDGHLNQARMELAKPNIAFQRVLECMKADPIPVSNNDLLLFYMMISNPERRTMAEGMKAIHLLAEDAQKRVNRGEGVTPKGAPRVAWAMPWFTDPAINAMVEQTGLAPVVTPFFWIHPNDLVKSKYSTYEERAAEQYMRMGLTHSTSAFVFRITECIKYFNLDGVVWNAMYPCRPTGGHPLIIKKLVEERARVPLLTIECDQMDSRDSPTEVLRTRMETFAEMLEMRKAAKP